MEVLTAEISNLKTLFVKATKDELDIRNGRMITDLSVVEMKLLSGVNKKIVALVDRLTYLERTLQSQSDSHLQCNT